MAKKIKKLTLTGIPNPKQDAFFSAKGRHIAYGGARGGGKSWALRRLFIMLALAYSNLRLLLLRRTLQELRENHVLPMMAELNGFANYKDEEKAFVFPNGSRIKLGYCDTEKDVLQYQGQEHDVIGLEEATHFTEYQMQFLTTCNRGTRADFSPVMYYTSNPGGVGHQWFKRLFIDRLYQGREKSENYVFIQATVYDNTVLMENNPEYVEHLENLPEDLRRAHLDGDWEVFAGQYFREWRRAIHMVTPFELPSYWKRFRSLDYGIDCTACYWWACSPDGRHYIYRELYQGGLNLTQAAERIVKMTPISEVISYTTASPDLWNRRQETGYSGQEIMRKAGLTGLVKAKHDRVAGWRAMREFLAPYDDEQGIKVARLQFFDNCVNAIRTIPLLQHDENDPEDAADRPHEVTHANESIRYGVMSRPRPGEIPKPELTGTYHAGELRMLGYSDRQIRRMSSKLKIIGGKKHGQNHL
ncbi:MAG: phage terminase large subunit [Dehalococcoidia bacterium]